MVACGSRWSWTGPSLWDLCSCWGVSFESMLVKFLDSFGIWKEPPITYCFPLVSKVPFPIPEDIVEVRFAEHWMHTRWPQTSVVQSWLPDIRWFAEVHCQRVGFNSKRVRSFSQSSAGRHGHPRHCFPHSFRCAVVEDNQVWCFFVSQLHFFDEFSVLISSGGSWPPRFLRKNTCPT